MNNKIKTIYISNILEGYYKGYAALKSKRECNYWTQFDIFDSNRALLYGNDDKIIVTSSPIHHRHFKNLNELMGWKNVQNISPHTKTHSISEDSVNDIFLNKEITTLIKNNPGISLIPYRLTPQFQKLIHYLKTKKLHFETPETIPEEKQFILNYFNTKRGFRHLWLVSQADNPPYVRMPDGFITQDKKEAIDAAWWFKQRAESFVIKYNSGVQGIGVEMIDQKKLPLEKNKFTERMMNILKDTMWDEPVIIVEKSIPPNNKAESISPSLEIYINPKGEVSGSYACDQILASDKRTYRGIYIYPKLMTDPSIKKTFDAGIKFGKKLAEYGYRGIFDIDLIRSHRNEIYAVEANLRRNGGTHLHELCLSLLGKDYGSTYHTMIEDILLHKKHSLTYEKCQVLFASQLYTHKKNSGIIFSNPDMLKVNLLAVVVIAKTKKEIKRLRENIGIVLKEFMVEEKLSERDW
jgi:hypothetical protein